MWGQTKPILVLVLLLTDGLPARYGVISGANGQLFEENITSKMQQLCPNSRTCSQSGRGPYLPSGVVPCCSKCACDEDCLLYGTCCPDSPFFDQQQPNYPVQCIDTYMKTTSSQSRPILMVSKCRNDELLLAQGIDQSFISKCNSPNREVLKENTPVSSRNSHYVYRNVFCALCDGQTNTSEWKVTVWNVISPLSRDYQHIAQDIDSTYLQAIDYNNTDINIFFTSPNDLTYPPLCYLNSVRQCNVTGMWNGSDPSLERACKAFSAPYITSASTEGGFSYNNVFCALCNGIDLETICRGRPVGPMPREGFFSLLNFQEEVRSHVTVPDQASTGNLCSEETFYDPYENGCRAWFCPKGFTKDRGQCESVWQFLYGFTFFILVKATPLVGDVELSAFDLYDVGIALETDMFACHDDVGPGISLGQISSPFMPNHRGIPYYVFLFRYRILNFTPGMHIMKSLLNCVGSFNTSSGENLTMFKYEHSDNIAMHLGRNPNKKMYFPSPVILADEEDHILYNHFISTRFSVPIDSVFRASRFLFCTQVLLEIGQFEIHSKKLFLPNKNLTLYQNVYERDDDGRVRICLDDYLRQFNTTGALDHTLSVMNTVSTVLFVAYAILAVLCLVAALTALVWIARIRTVFRIACIVFICHLMTTQILTVTSQFVNNQEYHGLCGALGVVLHVTWLATASLNNVFGSPLFLSQSSKYSESSRMAHVRMVVFDSLLCYLPSIVLPAILVGLSLYTSSGQRFGYGTRYCFIDTTQMFGYFFVLPLAISLLVSGVMCCWSRVTSKPPVVPNESGSSSFVWPTFTFAIFLNLASCGWLMVYLLQSDSFWHLFWICDVTLCVFALYSFVVQPMLNARQGFSES